VKLLVENWREYLSEGAKGPGDLPDDVEILIWSDEHSATIQYIAAGTVSSDEHTYSQDAYEASNKSPIRGRIEINEIGNPPCGGAWMVTWAAAEDGWGPLLYDVAIEWASWKAGGLIPDRRTVSKAARKVWKYYLSNRADVQSHQLDDENNTLTPQDDDNCNQDIATKSTVPVIGKFLSRDFASKSNAMSKRYTKEPTTLQSLIDTEKLIQK